MKTRDDDLVLIAPDPRKHAPALYDLTGKVFSDWGYYRWVQFCRREYFEHSHYDWGASTIGLSGGEVVTHWGVWGVQMRVGAGRLRAAGIGAVGTHGLLRKGGLMRRTAEAAIPRMRERGYDLSILFGIPDLYEKFGYVPAWQTPTYWVEARRLPGERPSRALHRFAARSRPDTDALYNRRSAGLAGTAVRPTCLGRRRAEWQGHLWRDPRGRTAGYVIVSTSNRKLALIDFAGESEEVLRVLGLLARRAGADEVRIPDLHWDSPLARRLREGFCRLELKYAPSGGAMVRTLNLASALGNLCPEFCRLLRRSDLAGWSGALRIEDPRQAATLEIRRGAASLARDLAARAGHWIRGGEHVVQLLIGTDEPARTMERGRIRSGGEAARLAEVLFPARHPMMSHWDHF
jgi:predicted N-acetyltransferase YhbS